MTAEERIVVEKIKEEMSAQGRMMRQINKMVPISGKRCTLDLGDRQIDMAYYPAETENAPLIMGFHGGGFVFGGSALDDGMWSAVSKTLGVNVASIDYRKCPDYRWPAPVHDAYDCACYLIDCAREFGFDPAHVSVMGCSAGANVAAAACIYAKQQGADPFESQILIYPCIDMATHPADKDPSGSFAPEALLAFNDMYIDVADAKNPLASPAFATTEDLAGLPRAIITTAQIDQLRHEGRRYVQMLKEAGVDAVHQEFAEMEHAYFEFGYIQNTEGRTDLSPYTLARLADGSMAQACQETLAFIKEYF